MGNLTKEQLENAIYRMSTLKSKMKALEEAITGESESFLSMITDGNGNVDPKKLDSTVKSMVESYKRCLEASGQKPAEHAEEMYYSFLYCAMLMTRKRENHLYPHFGKLEPSSVFSDILEIADEVLSGSVITSYRDFQKTVYYCNRQDRRNADALFYGIKDNGTEYKGCLSKFCRHVMRDISYDYDARFYNDLAILALPRETHIELCKEYALEFGISDENNKRYMEIAQDTEKYFRSAIDARMAYYEEAIERDERYYEAGLYDDVDGESEAREKYMEALAALGEDEDYKDHELLKDLTEDEVADLLYSIELRGDSDARMAYHDYIKDIRAEFRAHFLRFAELFYGHPHPDFISDITFAVLGFLIENGLTVLPFDDKYGPVMFRTEKAIKRIKLEIERTKNA